MRVRACAFSHRESGNKSAVAQIITGDPPFLPSFFLLGRGRRPATPTNSPTNSSIDLVYHICFKFSTSSSVDVSRKVDRKFNFNSYCNRNLMARLQLCDIETGLKGKGRVLDKQSA